MRKGILILSILCFLLCCNFVCGLDEVKVRADNINVTSYTELVEAIDNANSGDTLILGASIEIPSKIDINKSLTFKSSGNRSKLIYTGTDQVSLLSNTNAVYRHFNILSGVRVSFNKCDFVAGYDVYGGGVYLEEGGASITFTNCTFEGLENTLGGAVYVNSDTNMIDCGFVECGFKGNQAERGGAVYVKNASTYFETCTFDDNIALYDGSAICVDNYKATSEAVITINRCDFTRNITKSINNKKAGVISLNENYTEIESGEEYSESLGFAIIQNCKFTSNIALKSGIDSPCGVVLYLENYVCRFEKCDVIANTNQGDAIIMAVYTSARPSFNFRNSIIQQNYVYGNACAIAVRSDKDGYFSVLNCRFIDNISKDGENIVYGPYTTGVQVVLDAIIDELTSVENSNTNLPTIGKNNDNVDGNVVFTWINVVMLVISVAGIITSIILANRKKIVIAPESSVEVDNVNKNIEVIENVTTNENETNESINEEIDINALIKEYGLTRREGDVLDLILKGKKRGEIADELYVTAETVKTHTKNIYKKFGVNTKVELLLKLKK